MPVSVNGDPAQPLRLEVDSTGFTPSILAALPASPTAGPWVSVIIHGTGAAKLVLSIAHYPDTEPVLHQDSASGEVRAGLRSKKTREFVAGFVTQSPSLVAVYDAEHLKTSGARTSEAASSPGLPVVGARSAAGLELRAESLKELTSYAAAGQKSEKETWWRLVDALGALGATPLSSKVAAHYQGREGTPRTLEVSGQTLQEHPDAVLLKLNRRGQWKLQSHLPGAPVVTVVVNQIELLTADDP